ncbi:MAG: hypothetical protein QG657_2660 [Acidobacteriota bacterium]|nr:hypothetical protein [Acidobacteriota bacterium]
MATLLFQSRRLLSLAGRFRIKRLGDNQIIPISVTATGNILIRETKKENSKEIQYRLITGKGDILATIRTAAKVVTVSKNLILYTLEDEDENLMLYCVKIEGDEKKSLLRL